MYYNYIMKYVDKSNYDLWKNSFHIRVSGHINNAHQRAKRGVLVEDIVDVSASSPSPTPKKSKGRSRVKQCLASEGNVTTRAKRPTTSSAKQQSPSVPASTRDSASLSPTRVKISTSKKQREMDSTPSSGSPSPYTSKVRQYSRPGNMNKNTGKRVSSRIHPSHDWNCSSLSSGRKSKSQSRSRSPISPASRSVPASTRDSASLSPTRVKTSTSENQREMDSTPSSGSSSPYTSKVRQYSRPGNINKNTGKRVSSRTHLSHDCKRSNLSPGRKSKSPSRSRSPILPASRSSGGRKNNAVRDCSPSRKTSPASSRSSGTTTSDDDRGYRIIRSGQPSPQREPRGQSRSASRSPLNSDLDDRRRNRDTSVLQRGQDQSPTRTRRTSESSSTLVISGGKKRPIVSSPAASTPRYQKQSQVLLVPGSGEEPRDRFVTKRSPLSLRDGVRGESNARFSDVLQTSPVFGKLSKKRPASSTPISSKKSKMSVFPRVNLSAKMPDKGKSRAVLESPSKKRTLSTPTGRARTQKPEDTVSPLGDISHGRDQSQERYKVSQRSKSSRIETQSSPSLLNDQDRSRAFVRSYVQRTQKH